MGFGNRIGAAMTAAMLVCLAALVGGELRAQGALTLTTNYSHLTSNGSTGVSFDIVTGSTPVKIWRIGTVAYSSGSNVNNIFYNPTGMSTVYPTTGTANFNSTGWVSLGSYTMVGATAGVITQIPLDLNIVIPANSRYGFALTGTIRYWHSGTSAVPAPNSVSDQHITIDYTGFGGGNATAPAGSLWSRAFGGTIYYDLDQIQGVHTSVASVQVNNGDGLALGNNTVQAVLRNMGTAALDNTPIHAEYSTNGGTSWVGAQTFTFPSFPALTTQTATFTLPWNVAAYAVNELQVRLIAPTPIGQGDALKTRTYTPDLDVTVVTTNPTPAVLNAPLTVGFTLTNNGDWNHNGQQIPVRYSIDGVNYVTQNVTPTTLAANSDTQTFTFTAPLTLTTAGSYDLDVEIFPQVGGDPDPSDTMRLLLDNVGIPFVEFGTGVSAATLGPPLYRGSSLTGAGNYCVYQMLYTPAQLPGLPSGVAMSNLQFFKTNDTRTVTGLSHPMRVWLMNTTATTLVGNETVGNIPLNSGELVYENLNYVFPPDIGWLNFGPFNQATPFIYGGDSLLVTVEWAGTGPTATTGLTGTFAWRYDTVSSATPSGRGYQTTSAAGPLPTASVTLSSLSSSVRKPHARFFYIPPTNTDLDVDSISFGASAPFSASPQIGSNVVNATIRTFGSLPYTGSFNLQYSFDNGSNWVSNAPFTASGLSQIGNSQMVTFTTPWVIGSPLAPQSLKVRFNPPVAGDPDTVDELTVGYTVDADVDEVKFEGAVYVLNVPITVRAVIKNNGGMGLNGQSIPLRYSIDGTNWVNQTFTATTLGENGASEEFTFTTPVTFTTAASQTITVQISPALPGDTDSPDENSVTIPNVGDPTLNLTTTDFPGATSFTGSNGIPFGNYGAAVGYLTGWTPEQLRGYQGDILEFGFQHSTVSSKAWPQMRITMGEYSANPTAGGGPFLGAFDIPAKPPVLVYDGPVSITITAVDQYFRHVLQTPFTYSGQNNLGVYVELIGGTSTASMSVRNYSSPQNIRLWNTSSNGPNSASFGANFGHPASFVFTRTANPGIAVTRAGGVGAVTNGLGDDLGISLNATVPGTVNYTITNRGASLPLTIASITVSDQVNCTAALSGAAPTSVLPNGGTANFGVNVTAGAGAFSYKVTIVNNSSITTDQTFVTNASGIGFVNTAPVVSLQGSPGTQVSGTHPSFLVEVVSGESVGLTITASDVDSHQTVGMVVDVAPGGSLTPAQAGLGAVTFPVTLPPGTPPQSLPVIATAGSAGTINFTAVATDSATATDTVNFTVRIGARLDLVLAETESQFTRVSGQKDFYRGQTGQPVEIRVTNNNPFAITLNSLDISAQPAAGGAALTGFTFNTPSLPMSIPANTTNVQIPCTMDIAANASGGNNLACELTVNTGLAVDPAAPTTNPIIVIVTAPADEFQLFDGPVPTPMQISLTSLKPAVETVAYLQELTVTGGLGTYTWSITSGALPPGLTLNAAGSSILNASISGTPALATNGPYPLTLQVSDGAYLATTTLTMTVSQLQPLNLGTLTLANAREFVPYTMTTPLAATGGSLIYTYGIDAFLGDSLPAGLTLDSNTGVITGTPDFLEAGTYNLYFTVDDGITLLTHSTPTALVVEAHPLQWNTTALPTANETVAYSFTLDTIGGTAPRLYSITSTGTLGSLPTGLTLDIQTGVISGVPGVGTSGTYSIEFTVESGPTESEFRMLDLDVVLPPPLTITTAALAYAEVGQPYSLSITATGGSQVYTFSTGGGVLSVPNSIALSANGELAGTPEIGQDGRFSITVIVNDGYGTDSSTFDFIVLAPHQDRVVISEIDVGTGYVEVSNSSTSIPVDLSGWRVVAWVDGAAPTALAFDTIPGASLALPGEVVTLNMGGTAGGLWPTYSTGTSWTATSTSDLAVALYDIHGNLNDFVVIGTVNVAALVDAAASPAEIHDSFAGRAAVQGGAANYSLGANAAFTGSAAGSPGVYNAGLPVQVLDLVKDELRVAVEGETYWDFTVAKGGTLPYVYSITAPGAAWLSINPTTGELSGTAPASSAGTVIVDLTVTDASLAVVTETVTLHILAATTAPSATFTVGLGEGQSFEGTEIEVPVSLSLATGVSGITSFSFVIDLPPTTAGELAAWRVLPGGATAAAGRGVIARDIGNDRIFVSDIDLGGATNIDAGVVALVRFMVPMDDNVDAPEGNYPVNISEVAAGGATGPILAGGVNGGMELSNYAPADVNRDNIIDVVDVQLTVNIILSLFAPVYNLQGDANGDLLIDVVDVQTVVNCILFGGCD